jgi:hypothetical protein
MAHTKNTIWRSARSWASNFIHAEGVQSLYFRKKRSARRALLHSGKPFARAQADLFCPARWVIFREQTRVISRECRSKTGGIRDHVARTLVALWQAATQGCHKDWQYHLVFGAINRDSAGAFESFSRWGAFILTYQHCASRGGNALSIRGMSFQRNGP